VRAVVMEVAGRSQARARAVLAVVEDLLGEDGDAARVAADFLEDLQNVASHLIEGMITSEALLPLCGPRTVAVWLSVDRFWNDVVAWCDENGVDLKSSESLRAIQNSELRLHMWPSSRTLADGRRVGMAQAIRYEKATGIFMAVGGHGPPA
jgi:hypothetical protein